MLTYEIIGAIKRTFSRGKFAKAFKSARVLKGVKGPRGGKMVECADCKQPVSFSTSQMDHIDPCTPVMISQKVMSFAMLFERTFCEDTNLQLLCVPCHKIKSKKELGERVRWRKLKKWLVCRHRFGNRMKVIGIINLKELPEHSEVLAVTALKKDADVEMQRRKKL